MRHIQLRGLIAACVKEDVTGERFNKLFFQPIYVFLVTYPAADVGALNRLRLIESCRIPYAQYTDMADAAKDMVPKRKILLTRKLKLRTTTPGGNLEPWSNDNHLVVSYKCNRKLEYNKNSGLDIQPIKDAYYWVIRWGGLEQILDPDTQRAPSFRLG